MKKKITKSEWLKSVAKEVISLKKNATKEELHNLNFKTFDPTRKHTCIYGQMTGSCASSRAVKLIHSCCTKFTVTDTIDSEKLTFIETRDSINGNVKHSRSRGGYFDEITHFSSLEHYILLKGAKPKNVIKFLKGETNKLVL